MTGLALLLKSMGLEIDPDEIMKGYESLKTGLPEFALSLQRKVSEIDSRLQSIEQKLDTLLESQHGPDERTRSIQRDFDAINTASITSGDTSGNRSNGS